jgi:hypothetical protein
MEMKKKSQSVAKRSSKKSIVKLKMRKTMKEFKSGKLHSGSKKGPRVTSRKQAIAIGLSEARKRGAKLPKSRRTSSDPYVPTASTP